MKISQSLKQVRSRVWAKLGPLFRQLPDDIFDGDKLDTFITYSENKKLPRFQGLSVYPIVDCHLIDRRQPFRYFTIGQKPQDELVPSWTICPRVRWLEFVLSLVLIDGCMVKDLKFLFRVYRKQLLHDRTGKPINRMWHILKVYFGSRYFSLKFMKIVDRSDTVYITQYYNTIMLGIVRACNLLGREVVDIQHGYIGRNHDAYSDSDVFMSSGSYVPSRFIVFDDHFKREIESLTGRNAISTSYKHVTAFAPRMSPMKRNVILYTLQWGMPVPDEIRSLLDVFNDYRWWFRLHPLDNTSREDIQWLREHPAVTLDSRGLIGEILARTAVHVTMHSSACFEAREMGVISFYMHAESQQRFANEPMIYFMPPKQARNILEDFLSRTSASTDTQYLAPKSNLICASDTP